MMGGEWLSADIVVATYAWANLTVLVFTAIKLTSSHLSLANQSRKIHRVRNQCYAMLIAAEPSDATARSVARKLRT